MKKILRDPSGFLPPIDVICQYTKEGEIIPLRVRIPDEEGEPQEYTIKGYRVLAEMDSIPASDMMMLYECKIIVRDTMKRIRIYFNRQDQIWRINSIEG
ncbi:MAG: hypothetical protein IJ733_19770 [Lachnospiraceae bacterium]|nr:hypothetical protein [Lachnospiraceae bacterium]